MKLKKILLGLAYMSVMASCADLDYHEYTVYDKDYVFTDFGRTGAVVTNIYSYLDYDLPSEVSYCSACDEAQFAWSWSSIHDWINGAWSSTNSHSLWNYYSGIRDANFFLEESQNADFSELKEDKNYVAEMNRFNRYKYEVRFLRAYFYFNLVRAYGDIPLVTKVLTEEEANQVKRTPAAEVFDFIIKECDEIADELPVDYSKLENDAANGESPETGRITKQAVLALKARTLLYQASPLFNIANDVNLWKQAALASKKVIDFCAENGIKMGKYSELWGTDNWKASEMIFVRRIGDTSSPEYTNFPVGMENGGSGNCPTQTLVDAYEMKVTGKAWDEPESGYDPNKPYDNRDPRMKQTFLMPGTDYISPQDGALTCPPQFTIRPETRTGYKLWKYMAETSVPSDKDVYDYHIIRYPEVLLILAEATYEKDGAISDDILNKTINVIRSRKGVEMPPLTNAFVKSNGLDMRTEIRRERTIELAFEGFRRDDLRRWKTAETELIGAIKGIKLKGSEYENLDVLNEGNPGLTDENGFLIVEPAENRNFVTPKHYYYSLPLDELYLNPNLAPNNPGW